MDFEFVFVDLDPVFDPQIDAQRMKWIFLTLAIVLEVVGTTSMKLSDGFKQWGWGASMIVCYTLCFWFLSLAIKYFEMSVVYAVWSGLGIVLLALIGIFFFEESIGFWKIVCMALILIGVVGLNLATKHV
jgi:small multidrug resistance pump